MSRLKPRSTNLSKLRSCLRALKRRPYKFKTKSHLRSAEAAGDVGLRSWVAGRGEELRRGAELDHLARQEESGEIADACGLLHVVRDDGHGAEIFDLDEELFDFCGADGVESGAWLIEEEHFGFHGEAARDAEALLLAAGKFVSALVEMIFDFVPKRGMAKTFFNGFGDGQL